MSENSLAKKLRLQRSCRRCEHWLYPGCVLYSGITKPQIECDTFTLDDDTGDMGTRKELIEMGELTDEEMAEEMPEGECPSCWFGKGKHNYGKHCLFGEGA